jgi:hypothetical protein
VSGQSAIVHSSVSLLYLFAAQNDPTSGAAQESAALNPDFARAPKQWRGKEPAMLTIRKLSITLGVLGAMIATTTTASVARSHHVRALPHYYGQQHHYSQQHRYDNARGAYGSSTLTDPCRQTGPITLPATDPVCNRKGWFMGW